MLSALLLASGLAVAAPQMELIAVNGDPIPGRPARLLLLLSDEGQPVEAPPEAVTVDVGELGELTPGPAPGTWWAPLSPPREAGAALTISARVEGTSLRATLALGEPQGSGLEGPELIRGVVGQAEPVRVLIRTDAPITPEALQLAAPEGRFGSPEPVDGGLVVPWTPGQVREPRAVPLAIRDARRPEAPPLYVTVSLVAHKPVSVRTEPGARMSITVSGRTYGPVVADADGQASVRVEVRPGERSGEALLEDAVGNRQRSPLNLNPDPRPSLVLMAEGPLVAGAPPPSLHLRALTPAGRAWTGDAPTCSTGAGEALVVTPTGPGAYTAALPEGAPRVRELRVDCLLDEGAASASERLPVREGQPVRVGLTVWPEELSGDLPVAQVRAWLEDGRGDPMPPDGLVLSATHGQISELDAGELALRADLEAAPGSGDDELRAAWFAPTSTGLPWSLTLGTAPPSDGELQVQARALDRLGRPLEGVDITARVLVHGEPVGVAEGVSDAGGYAVLELPAPTAPAVLELRAPGVTRRAPLTPWWSPPPLDPGAPDLIAVRRVKVRAGRVSKVSVTAEPAVLYTGTGATGWVDVKLIDRSGLPVTDEPVRLEVSEGEIEAPVVRPDGSLRAVYKPPPGPRSGTVEVRVLSGSGAFPETSTRIDLAPRPISWAPGLAAGVITTFGAHTTFHASAQVDRAIPFLEDRQLYLRLALGYHQVRAQTSDEDRDGEIDLRMDLLPVSLAALIRRDLGPWAGWTGAGLALTPYRLDLRYQGAIATSGLGLHRPGPLIFVGGGYRVGSGEAFGELRALSVLSRAEDAGFDGQVGGFVFLVGYRILY